MTKKILASLIAVLGLGLTTTPALAQQIPSGYALVPISSLSTSSTPVVNTATVSPAKSTLRANKELAFLGADKLMLTATLRDPTGSPLAGHTVNLIGSRPTDQIQALQDTTNTNGEALFSIVGSVEGIGTFTAIDTASGVVLSERSRIVFLGGGDAIGGEGNPLSAELLAQATGSTAPLANEKLVASFPSTVAINEPTDITINITDLTDNTLEEYAGTISFQSTDPLALLPRDYTFTPLDRGIHTFANAVTLIQPGTTTITTSSDTAAPETESVVIVQGDPTGQTGAPVIISPATGSLFGQNTLTVSGTTTANSNLAIFVDSQISERGASDPNGEFTVQLSGLTDGEHQIKATLLDFNNSILSISSPITINIDTTPPQLSDITITPQSVLSGSDITITAQSESGLSSVSFGTNGKDFALIESTAGIYAAQVPAITPGTHSIDITLVDTAGNSTTVPAAASFTIETPITIQPVETTPQSKRVNLSWNPPANQDKVDHYKITYGQNTDDLNQEYTTTDNSTEWHIAGLNDHTAYYFQIFSYSVDNIPNGQSEVLSETPRSVLNIRATACDANVQLDWQKQPDDRIRRYQIAYGLSAGNYLEHQSLPDDRTTWEIRNLINDVPYYFTIRGLDAANQLVFQTNEEAVATPSGSSCHDAAEPIIEQPIELWQQTDSTGETILVWNPEPNATSYRVYAGTEPNNFDLPTAEVTTPYLKPTGLAANTEYFFAVRALYGDGHEAANFSNVLSVEVGPAEALALAAGLAIMGSWLLRRRRQ